MRTPRPGELLSDAVRRRAADELGLEVSSLRLVLPGFAYEAEQDGLVERELCPVLTGRVDVAAGQRPAVDSSEVEDLEWVSWPDFVGDVLGSGGRSPSGAAPRLPPLARWAPTRPAGRPVIRTICRPPVPPSRPPSVPFRVAGGLDRADLCLSRPAGPAGWAASGQPAPALDWPLRPQPGPAPTGGGGSLLGSDFPAGAGLWGRVAARGLRLPGRGWVVGTGRCSGAQTFRPGLGCGAGPLLGGSDYPAGAGLRSVLPGCGRRCRPYGLGRARGERRGSCPVAQPVAEHIRCVRERGPPGGTGPRRGSPRE